MSDTHELKQGFTTFGAWALGVGALIGSMAWLIHAPMIATAGHLGATLAWLLAGVLSIPLALILMELSSMFPKAGGPYFYKYYALKRLVPKYGELMGFLTGWLFWIALTVGLAMMSLGLVRLLQQAFHGYWIVQHALFGPVTVLALFVPTALLNLRSSSESSKLTVAFCILKISMAVFFVLLVATSRKWSLPQAIYAGFTTPGFTAPNFTPPHFISSTSALHSQTLSAGASNTLGEALNSVRSLCAQVGSVLMLALTGFTFLEITGCTSAETYDATKSVPRAMMLTLVTGALVFAAISFCTAGIMNTTIDRATNTLTIDGTNLEATCPGLVTFLAGPAVGFVFFCGVIASIVGGAFGAILALARVGYSMAESGLFPNQFAQINSHGVPAYALWFQCACVVIVALSTLLLSNLGWFSNAYLFLGETFGFMYALIGMLYAVCFLSLRYTEPERSRPFRAGNKLAAWALSLITIAIWGYAAFGCVQWIHQLAGLVIMLSGVPVYYFYKCRRS